MIGGVGGIGSTYIPEITTGFGASTSDGKRQDSQSSHGAQAVVRKPEANTDATGLTLSPEKQKVVQQLQARDREVRSHESAHIAAGAGLTSGAQYSLAKGPDNRQYATGGSVSIDTSAVSGDPEATIEKAKKVRAAALAPASPSGPDLQVSAKASQMETKARMDKMSEYQKNPSSKGELLSAVA